MAWKFIYCTYRRHVCLLLIALISFTFLFSQTIFQPADAPASPLLNDGQSIQVGIKFRSSQNGYIKGIRYYKGAGSISSRIGQLWSRNGTLLASAPFDNETASGWQEVLFNTPYAITADTTYVAACFSSTGDYAITSNYFGQAVTNGPLRGLAGGEDGPNGVFIFSSIPMFPTNSFQSANYWVDVVFAETTGPDVYPPVISSVSPASAATGVGLSAPVSATFNEAINQATISNATVELRNTVSNALITATVTYNTSTRTVTLTPSSSFANSTSYTVKIKGGASGVKDIAGNALANDYTWSFTSVDLPFLPPGLGYGGPILVLNNATNPFSGYAAEILRAEGLTEFSVKDISAITFGALSNFDVIIVGETTVTSEQLTVLSNWVNEGGTLITFKPDASLTPLLGITTSTGTLSNKYLRVNNVAGPGIGITGETIQFHGDANLHTLNGATSLATLYTDAATATTNPAVTTINVGTNGGKAIAFTYDLARSIIYTRQGNPAWAGQERDGQAPIRSDDLFFGVPQNSGTDWVDFNKIAIPQADEQQRLLANIIIQGNLHRKPLPRLWYLPKGLKAAIVMTGDDHAANGTTGRFNHYLSLGPNSPEDVANWNAIRGTSYIYSNTPITNAQATSFQSQGFEIAMHPNTSCTNYTEASLNNTINAQSADFSSVFPGLSAPVTNRTHCLVWSDWASHAKVEASHGMRLDVNYYYWPGAWVKNRSGMFTGSGMPMRFADTDGSLIDCYQVTTQMTDESGIDYTDFCNQLLGKATGPEGFYGTFCANMHTDSANHIGSNSIIASAMAHKVPVISSKQLLAWLDGRNNSSFNNIIWNNSQLSFTINAPSGARNLNGMLPRYNGDAELISITRDGVSVIAKIELIKGIEYVFFNVAIGSYTYIASYNSAPAITVHPAPQTVCAGTEVSFTSAANGSPAPSVQWQQTQNGNTWTNINGAVNSTLTFTATIADNSKQYRAVWTNSNGTVNSNPAALIAQAVPVLSSPLQAPAINSGTVFSYTPASTTAGTTFSWSRAEVLGITNPAATGTGSISETLINATNSTIIVRYLYTLAANGCSNTQYVVVKVEPAPENCSFSTSIAANFNGTSISGGRYIWFNSLFKPGSLGNAPVNFYVTDGRISYTVNNQVITLRVPDAHIKFASTITAATTRFVDGKWQTEVPIAYNGNVFMAGLSYRLPSSLPGGIRNVTWSATIETDKEDASLQWKWTAGVYTNFADNAGLNVKPIDGLLYILNPLLSIGNAGTPQNYSLFIIPGAMGAGLLNITNTYSATKSESCATSGNRITSVRQTAVQSTIAAEEQARPIDQQLTIVALPNPASSSFNLTVKGNGKETVTVRILDIFGQVIEKHEKINAAGVLRVGDNWTGGTYFAEVIRGSERKVIKLIKTN